MPNLNGVFDKFHGLESISLVDVARWINFKVEPHYLENYLANRIIYPQTIAMTSREMEVDLAILREALKRDEKVIFNRPKSSIILTEEFLIHFPQKSLALALVDGLNLPEKTLVVLKGESGIKPLGTIINWRGSSEKKFDLMLQTGDEKTPPEKLTIAQGDLRIVTCQIKGAMLRINNTKLMEVMGGPLGVVVDTREIKSS